MIQILMMTRRATKYICKSSFVYAWYISKNVFYKAYCFSLHLHIILIFLYSFIQLSHNRKKVLSIFFSLLDVICNLKILVLLTKQHGK